MAKSIGFSSFLFFGIVALFAVAQEEIAREDEVLVITAANLEGALQKHQNILIEFYAPWCGHCKALAPEYASAAKKLKSQSSEIVLGKVDATVETSLAEKHGIRGYPTIKFFRDGKPSEYTGGRTADEIVTWLTKKTGPPAKKIATSDEASKFKEEAEVVVVGFYADETSDNAKVFLEVARNIDDHPFAIVSESSVFSEYNVDKDSIILFKKFDEGRVDFDGDHTTEAITKFIKGNSLPLVVDFSHESAQKIFGGEVKNHALLFLSKAASDYEDILKRARTVAAEFRSKVIFVSVDTDLEDNERILDFFGLKKEQVPTLRLIKLDEEMTKYKPEQDELTEEVFREFIQAYLNGQLKPHLLSQVLPEDWDKHPVKVLVSKNFDDVAFNKSADVLVEFYAPWCGHCKQLEPIYVELGEKFQDNPTVVIAKMDATANELEHTKIQSFPTIKLYKKETNEVVEYAGERNLEGLTKFIETGGDYGRGAPEKVVEYVGPRALGNLVTFVQTGGKAQQDQLEEEEDEEEVDDEKHRDEL